MKINSKKLGVLLGILFAIGITTSILYAQSYAWHRLPQVSVAYASSISLDDWYIEARGILQPASDEFLARGVEWTIGLTIPREAFVEVFDDLRHTITTITPDATGITTQNIPSPLFGEMSLEDIAALTQPTTINLERGNTENGDELVIFGYIDHARQIVSGEGVYIRFMRSTPDDLLQNMIPLSAVGRDIFTGDFYVYTLQMRQGAWGLEYFAQRQNLVISQALPERVFHYIPIASPDLSEIPFIIYSDRQIISGGRVRLP